MGNLVKALIIFWKARNEFSVRKIRFSKWNAILLFATVVVMNDLRFVESGDQLLLFDSLTVEMMCYAVGIFIFAFLSSVHILDTGRFGAVLALAALIAQNIVPSSALFEFYTIYAFAGGLCFAYALYIFFFVLNNTERFFNLIIVQLYFSVCVYGLWENTGLQTFLSGVLVYILVSFFALSLFTARKGDIPKKPLPLNGGCGSSDECCRVGKGGMAAIFYVYIIFIIVDSINKFIIHNDAFIDRFAYGAGALTAVAVAVCIQLLLGKSGLYTWKIFLVGSIISLALLAMNSIFNIKAGSMLFGFAHSLGYISIFYFLGGAAYITGCLKLFRRFCFLAFLLLFVMDPVVEYLFASVDEENHIIALSLMVAIVSLTFLLYPALYKKIFESDWIEDVRILKQKGIRRDLVGVSAPEAGRTEALGLTPREKQIFTLMLTEKSVKQIMIELEISKGTFNFHTANLYRKLEIQSRMELFAKFGHQ